MGQKSATSSIDVEGTRTLPGLPEEPPVEIWFSRTMALEILPAAADSPPQKAPVRPAISIADWPIPPPPQEAPPPWISLHDVALVPAALKVFNMPHLWRCPWLWALDWRCHQPTWAPSDEEASHSSNIEVIAQPLPVGYQAPLRPPGNFPGWACLHHPSLLLCLLLLRWL